MEAVVLLLVLLLLPFSASDQSSNEDLSGTYGKRRWGIRLGWHGTWAMGEKYKGCVWNVCTSKAYDFDNVVLS